MVFIIGGPFAQLLDVGVDGKWVRLLVMRFLSGCVRVGRAVCPGSSDMGYRSSLPFKTFFFLVGWLFHAAAPFGAGSVASSVASQEKIDQEKID